MREKPPLQEERIRSHIARAFGLPFAHLEFLPLGYDINSAVYRAVSTDSAVYFLKLRKENFEETSLLVPQFLHKQGIRQVIPPLETIEGQLWSNLDEYKCILYPFITGQDGFTAALSDRQWTAFGAALKGIHTAPLPTELSAKISTENFTPRWRDEVRQFQAQVETADFTDPTAREMAAFMREHRQVISRLTGQAEQLALQVRTQRLRKVLCHSDIHAGNLLLAEDDSLYIVDWDNPILAPKERDLMFIGGGIGDIWNSTRTEYLFYQGYGPTEINRIALAYYRYERIVQDIAAYCEQILLTDEGGADREQSLYYFKSNFTPNSVLDIADNTLKESQDLE